MIFEADRFICINAARNNSYKDSIQDPHSTELQDAAGLQILSHAKMPGGSYSTMSPQLADAHPTQFRMCIQLQKQGSEAAGNLGKTEVWAEQGRGEETERIWEPNRGQEKKGGQESQGAMEDKRGWRFQFLSSSDY